MNFFKVGQAAVLALGDRRDAHEAAHADIFALLCLLRCLRKIFRGKAAFGFLAADIHLAQDIHNYPLCKGTVGYFLCKTDAVNGLDHRHTIYDILNFVALQVPDEVNFSIFYILFFFA